ncbi:MAG: ABC transporter substrate-binding protein [Burkholderiales bacterium]
MNFRPGLLVLSLLAAAAGGGNAIAQSIRVGELNSYKLFPAFLEPYKKGWQLALEEINAAGGINGRTLEVVSRDDGGNPGTAVRVAEELIARDKVSMLMGEFASNIGLAVSNLANQRKVVFLAAEPLTDKLVWGDGNRYTFRLRPSTYMQVAMLVPEAAKLHKKHWAIVYPNYEYGQSATESFKKLMTAAQPGIEIVTEQAPPLGKIDAGAVVQALSDAKPDAIFSSLFGADLQKFVREGNIRGLFKGRAVVNLLGGEPEYLEPLKDETPVGWWVTGYPWRQIRTPEHKKFVAAYEKRWRSHPYLGSVVGYAAMYSVADALKKAGSTDSDALIAALEGLEVQTPFGRVVYRAVDHQSTMGAYVGQLAKKNGEGVMVNWHFADGADYLPSPAETRLLRRQ